MYQVYIEAKVRSTYNNKYDYSYAYLIFSEDMNIQIISYHLHVYVDWCILVYFTCDEPSTNSQRIKEDYTTVKIYTWNKTDFQTPFQFFKTMDREKLKAYIVDILDQ